MISLPFEHEIRRRFEVRGRSGSEFICVCSFHDDTGKPNLYVNGESGLYFCHACEAKGSLGGEKREPRISDMRAIIDRLREEDNEETDAYDDSWLDQFYMVPTDYWPGRGLSEATIRRFQLGYDLFRDEGIIPVRDNHGTLIGVIRRRLGPIDPDQNRYLYPKKFPLSKTLFGAWMLGKKNNKVMLVEGSVDAMAGWNARIPTLAILGSHLSDEQNRLLHILGIDHVVLFMDNDTAGKNATAQIIEDLSGITISIAKYRSYWTGNDPAKLTPQQIRKAFHSANMLTGHVD